MHSALILSLFAVSALGVPVEPRDAEPQWPSWFHWRQRGGQTGEPCTKSHPAVPLSTGSPAPVGGQGTSALGGNGSNVIKVPNQASNAANPQSFHWPSGFPSSFHFPSRPSSTSTPALSSSTGTTQPAQPQPTLPAPSTTSTIALPASTSSASAPSSTSTGTTGPSSGSDGSPVDSSLGTPVSYLSVANKWRSVYGLPTFTWSKELTNRCQGRVNDNKGYIMSHGDGTQEQPGHYFGEVISGGFKGVYPSVAGMKNHTAFEVNYLSAWMCEVVDPQIQDECAFVKTIQPMNYNGADGKPQTGHHDLLTNPKYNYKYLGCAFATDSRDNGGSYAGRTNGEWCCEMASEGNVSN